VWVRRRDHVVVRCSVRRVARTILAYIVYSVRG